MFVQITDLSNWLSCKELRFRFSRSIAIFTKANDHYMFIMNECRSDQCTFVVTLSRPMEGLGIAWKSGSTILNVCIYCSIPIRVENQMKGLKCALLSRSFDCQSAHCHPSLDWNAQEENCTLPVYKTLNFAFLSPRIPKLLIEEISSPAKYSKIWWVSNEKVSEDAKLWFRLSRVFKVLQQNINFLSLMAVFLRS